MDGWMDGWMNGRVKLRNNTTCRKK